MTIAELHNFFCPYVREKYQTESADGMQEAFFVSLAGQRQWATRMGVSLREAMIQLLGYNIWPERFRRNFGLVTAQELALLLQSHALVLGCGGLGGHVAELLARSGVGVIRLVDNDVFDESNLNRQRFCSERVLGMPKARVVRAALSDIASHVEAEALELAAGEDNLSSLVAGMDVALDCLDSIPAKILLERTALAAGVPFVHGSVLREEGFSFANSGPEARLEKLYPQGQSAQELEHARHEGVGALTPASVAPLMVELCLCTLLGRNTNTPLLYLDLTVPALEHFGWADDA